MWRLALPVIALVEALSAAESSEHKVFRIWPENEEQLKFLRSLSNDEENEWSFWKEPSAISRAVDLMVAPDKLNYFNFLMISKGIAYDTFIDNVEELIAAQTKESTQSRSVKLNFGWTRYNNLEEIYNWIDSIASEFPSQVKPLIGGRSDENRQIRGLKLSFGRSSKPGIFIEGGIHAREWISPATVTYLIDQLLRSKEPQVRGLAEAYDWYIFPVFNPDGYAYTHLDPNNVKNRSWRKTRSTNNSSKCLGTDLNRNWGFEWMTAGVSNDACSNNYAGSAAFSTSEAKTLSQYINSISDKLFAYLSFHSYSQVLIFPYGHTTEPLDNYNQTLAIANETINAISCRYGSRYRTGTIGQIIGLASGGSVDWVKAKFKLPLVYVYELRDNGKYGHLLPPDQIIPTGEEVLDSFVTLFQEAKNYGYPS